MALTFLFQGLILAGVLSKVGVGGPILLWVLLTAYLALAIRKVYDQRKWYLVASVFVGFVALAVTHIIYRFVLFMLTFWTT